LVLALAAGVTFMTGKVDSVSHGDGQSTVLLEGAEGVTVSGSLVLDATGHSRRLVQFDKKFDPGYQGAYGIVAGG
jgi:lycopene beta-cyclase